MTLKRNLKKKCSIEGCDRYVYARGFCRFHYGTEFLAPKQNEKPSKQVHIARRTKKRSLQEAKYHTNRKAFIQAEKDAHPQGKIFCIFCDKEIHGEPSLHHAFGRDDDKILDESFWFLSHNHCHVFEYHSKGCKDISWWDNYMFRIKEINPEVYQKERIRQDKAKTQ